MSDQFITLNDEKIFLMGVAVTLVASAIIYFARQSITSSAKIIWAYGNADFIIGAKSGIEHIEHHEITIENVGRGLARQIVIVLPKIKTNFDLRKMDRSSSGWNGWYTAKTSSFSITEESEHMKLLIPFLEGRKIVKISFFTNFRNLVRPESVSYDGGIGLDRILHPAYFRIRDVIRPHGIRFAVFVVTICISVAIALLVPRK